MEWEASADPSYESIETPMLNMMGSAGEFRVNGRSCIFLFKILARDFLRITLPVEHTMPLQTVFRLFACPMWLFDRNAATGTGGPLGEPSSVPICPPRQIDMAECVHFGNPYLLKHLLTSGYQVTVRTTDRNLGMAKYQLMRFL